MRKYAYAEKVFGAILNSEIDEDCVVLHYSHRNKFAKFHVNISSNKYSFKYTDSNLNVRIQFLCTLQDDNTFKSEFVHLMGIFDGNHYNYFEIACPKAVLAKFAPHFTTLYVIDKLQYA
jgi:hypothetical protein